MDKMIGIDGHLGHGAVSDPDVYIRYTLPMALTLSQLIFYT